MTHYTQTYTYYNVYVTYTHIYKSYKNLHIASNFEETERKSQLESIENPSFCIYYTFMYGKMAVI